MKILFALNHPAQYHLFKNPFRALSDKGHDVLFVIKDKDILENLLISEGLAYKKLTRKRIGRNRLTVLLKGVIDLTIQDLALLRFVLFHKPDIMVGTDYCITHVGTLLNIKTIVFNEDDYGVNKFFCQLTYPFCNTIVTPRVCDVGKYKRKQVCYEGYQKLAYLHPSVFIPNRGIASKYVDLKNRYFIIRLVSLSAGHDVEMNHGGIAKDTLPALIRLLKDHGDVFITSESKLPLCFKEYALTIDPKDIHHLLFFSDLFIGDSQSMIVEASMLGVPSIRFNSFVGKISVLNELEQHYQLTYGIHNSHPEQLLDKVKELITDANLKEEFQKRRNRMLKDKINVSQFVTWFIENYPRSLTTTQDSQNSHQIFGD